MKKIKIKYYIPVSRMYCFWVAKLCGILSQIENENPLVPLAPSPRGQVSGSNKHESVYWLMIRHASSSWKKSNFLKFFSKSSEFWILDINLPQWAESPCHYHRVPQWLVDPRQFRGLWKWYRSSYRRRGRLLEAAPDRLLDKCHPRLWSMTNMPLVAGMKRSLG